MIHHVMKNIPFDSLASDPLRLRILSSAFAETMLGPWPLLRSETEIKYLRSLSGMPVPVAGSFADSCSQEGC